MDPDLKLNVFHFALKAVFMLMKRKIIREDVSLDTPVPVTLKLLSLCRVVVLDIRSVL